ncbi:unnamed protein product [Cuscuta europaea]|uniref:Uncharacterized protein n=1 Tax=Cuscuta europaea TaxID=41803 RepID=A0A9P0ZW07_CUSEU|nr:unnamed protein product [Cuscuta europaea]
MSESGSQWVGEEGSAADENGIGAVEPTNVDQVLIANNHSGGFEERETSDVKMAEDGGREDMFVDCPDEIETSETSPSIEDKDNIQDTQVEEGKASEMKKRDFKAEVEDLQTPPATQENLSHEYEVEKALLMKELTHLCNQLKALNEHQPSLVNTIDDNAVVEDSNKKYTGVGSTASLHGMISDCCSFLVDAMQERSNTESRIRELDAISHMKDHEIEALNTKLTEFSVLKDVALSHLSSEQEYASCMSEVQIENRKLLEELDKHKSMLEEANMEIAKLNAEVEQEKSRYTNAKEKLSLAVTKGKALVQQRDVLKQLLAEKTTELDKCLVELQEKSNALEVAEQTKELLARSNELATSLQDALLEKDSVLQKCGGTLSEAFGTEELPLADISENIRCLADERNSLKDIYLKFQKVTEVISSFDFPETMQSRTIDERISWLVESLYLAKEEAGKLQEEMAASKEAANNKIGQLMAEKNYLHGKLQEEVGAAREEAINVIDRLTVSLLVETQEKFYITEELGILNCIYEDISRKEHGLSMEKDHFVNTLLEAAAAVKLNDRELVCHQQSNISAIIEKCIVKIKEENPSFESSYIESESFQNIQKALYSRDLELKLYEAILAEEMLNKLEHENISRELVMATEKLNAVREEKNSLQMSLEQYEERVATLKEKLSMAVKKGKGVVLERENLKRTLDEKNFEIEKLKSELEQQQSMYSECKDQIEKLSADLALIPKLEADLASIEEQKHQIEQFLVESNGILQQVIESIDCITIPAVSGSEGPVEKVKSLVDCFGECKKEKIEAQQELALVKDEANNLVNKLLESQEAIKSLTDSLSIAENSIRHLQEEKKEQESSKSLIEQELQRTIDALSNTETVISQLLKDKNELESVRTSLQQELQKAVSEASAEKSKFSEVCASQKSIEDALLLSENKISALTNEKEDILRSRDETQVELQKIQEEYSADKGKLADANETIQSLEDALRRERENISLIAEENNKTHIGITLLETEIKKLKEEAESQNSKLADASVTIKSLEGELRSAEDKFFYLVNDKKNAEEEISDLNFKLSNCLRDLDQSHGSIETKDLELSGHVRSLVKDGNLLYAACQSLEQKFEKLNEMDFHLKEIEDWFPEVNFKVLQCHPLLKDDTSRSTAFLSGFHDVPNMEMANGGLNASSDEILKTVKALHHGNKNIADRFEGYSTLVGDLVTLFPKLMKSLKQNMDDVEADKQSLQSKTDMMERNLKVLYSACVGAIQELSSENSSFVIPDSVDEDEIVFNCSNSEKVAEKLLDAARHSQGLRKQIEDANDQMVETIKELQNKLTETSVVCERGLEEREIYLKRISQLESELDEAKGLCSELRLKLEDHQANEDHFKETMAELSALKSTVLLKEQENEDTLLSASQMRSLFDKINKIEIPLGGHEAGNQDIHETADVGKLFYVIDSFTELQNQTISLSRDKKELQSTLENKYFEIENLNGEMKKLSRDEKDCEKMKDELLKVKIGLENVIQKFGENNLLGAQKVAGVLGLLPVVEKLVMTVIYESENLKSQKAELGAQLLEMQKNLDELSCKARSLESSTQVDVIPGDIAPERVMAAAPSLPSQSEISEIQDLGSSTNNSASTSIPSAAHVRTLRKGSTDHLAVTIDSGTERLLNHDEASEDKGHLFKSLITTGLVPRQGRLLADRIDGIWVSSGRALMSRPRARIGLIVYSFLLHIWLLGTIL